MAEEFIGRNEAGWRNAKHRQQWRNTLASYVYPILGELPVTAIDSGLVIQVLEPIWTEKPETAREGPTALTTPNSRHLEGDGGAY